MVSISGMRLNSKTLNTQVQRLKFWTVSRVFIRRLVLELSQFYVVFLSGLLSGLF